MDSLLFDGDGSEDEAHPGAEHLLAGHESCVGQQEVLAPRADFLDLEADGEEAEARLILAGRRCMIGGCSPLDRRIAPSAVLVAILAATAIAAAWLGRPPAAGGRGGDDGAPGHVLEGLVETARVPTLFCFAVVSPQGEQLELLRQQMAIGAGLSACDGYTVFSEWKTWLATSPVPISTQELAPVPLEEREMEERQAGDFLLWSDSSAPSCSTLIRAWRQLGQDGTYLRYAWVVKVEPSTVFFPERLRTHLQDVASVDGRPQYVKNCNGDEPPGFGLYGALEVLSQSAAAAFIGGLARCEKQFHPRSRAEDYFLQTCLDALKVEPVVDFGLLKSEDCLVMPSPCTTGQAAFHPFTSWIDYMQCWKDAGGMPAAASLGGYGGGEALVRFGPGGERGIDRASMPAGTAAAAVAELTDERPMATTTTWTTSPHTRTSTSRTSTTRTRTTTTRTSTTTTPGPTATATRTATETATATRTATETATATSTQTQTKTTTTHTTITRTRTHTITETETRTRTTTSTATTTATTTATSTGTTTTRTSTTTTRSSTTTTTTTKTTTTATRTSTTTLTTTTETRTTTTITTTVTTTSTSTRVELPVEEIHAGDIVWLSDDTASVKQELQEVGLSWSDSMAGMLGQEFAVEEVRPGFVALPARDGAGLWFFPATAVRKVHDIVGDPAQPLASDQRPPWAREEEPEPPTSGGGGLAGILHLPSWLQPGWAR